MAVGASYPETGGLNQSSIHHDFVTKFDFESRISEMIKPFMKMVIGQFN